MARRRPGRGGRRGIPPSRGRRARCLPDVLIVRHDEPRGPPAARNKGADAVASDFVGFLNDDDTRPPGKVRWGLECLDRHPEAGMVIHQPGRFGADRRRRSDHARSRDQLARHGARLPDPPPTADQCRLDPDPKHRSPLQSGGPCKMAGAVRHPPPPGHGGPSLGYEARRWRRPVRGGRVRGWEPTRDQVG
jgi:Glycosyl transferase family 2